MTKPETPTLNPFLITTPSDLARLAASMRAHVAAAEGVASRVVRLATPGSAPCASQSFQLMLRPGPNHQIQLLVSAAGYRFPDAWLPELRAAFGVPDGTLMVYDLVKRVHQVVKWTWVEVVEAEQLQMSFAGMEVTEMGENYYQRGQG